MNAHAADWSQLQRLVGTWTTEATHPAMPGVVVHGTAQFEWLEGEKFLICRARTDHEKFPDSLVVIGVMESDRVDGKGGPSNAGDAGLCMHYFDSRGVFRLNEVRIDETAWHWWREAPGFSQRFTGTFADGGETIIGISQLSEDDVNWKDDLEITYRRET